MAAAEKELNTEIFMEERIARLETQVEHIHKDLTRIEGKVDKLDEKLDAKVGKLDEKIDAQNKRHEAFRLDVMNKFAQMAKGRMADKVWLLLIAAALLGVMARGFKWI
jgi:SMC interacting uncharacterized protein involved in chromosome segregation